MFIFYTLGLISQAMMKVLALRTEPIPAEIIPEPGPISTQIVGFKSRIVSSWFSMASRRRNESSAGSYTHSKSRLDKWEYFGVGIVWDIVFDLTQFLSLLIKVF